MTKCFLTHIVTANGFMMLCEVDQMMVSVSYWKLDTSAPSFKLHHSNGRAYEVGILRTIDEDALFQLSCTANYDVYKVKSMINTMVANLQPVETKRENAESWAVDLLP